ncbi:MAG: hypothetical protein M1840_007218 [Geoglossum simile]|nr:MAG: hypothetical protein M1840_007218 [Geoglossum simile]
MLPSSAASLESVFNHLVLPAKLPGKRDGEIEQIERHLATRLLNATDVLRGLSSDESAEAWDYIRRSLEICNIINEDGRLNKTSLLDAFQGLQSKHGLILHITEQNAGLLIRRHVNGDDESVIFEAFEASPISESVLASENALQWDFPGSAVSTPLSDFVSPSFQESLAAFLEQASMESIERFAAHARKAGVSVVESRDTVDPSLITQMFMTLLEANGCRIYPPMLRKRVRDDVCWDDAELPWRRCAYWLVLRVSVQRLLCFILGSEAGRAHYKFLISVVLARFLVDSLDRLGPEPCTVLKAKLCRRLAKLEVDKARAPASLRHVYIQMFAAVGPIFQEAIRKATEQIDSTWAAFKNTIRRPIPSLPLRADDKDLHLRLPYSAPYLQNILKLPLGRNQKPSSLASSPPPTKVTTEPLRVFADRYFSLAEMEGKIESSDWTTPSSMTKCEKCCMRLAKRIENYLETVGDSYDSSSEQMSILILNLFELWVSMDECATKVFPLLNDYHPGFHPQLLDVLQLPELQDMCRLQRIQTYLRVRSTQCGSANMTIFTGPVKGCFAARYFKESEDGPRLQGLQQQIETQSKNARIRKEREWKEASTTYGKLTREMSSTSCTRRLLGDGSHDIRGCRHCYVVRRCRRFQISIHEDSLPNNDSSDNIAQKQAIVFELGIPKPFAAYRDATWRILSTLGYPKEISASVSPEMLLGEYSQLKGHMSSTSARFSLASTTKSFLVAHYKKLRLPIALSEVIFPLGLDFSYYDTGSELWSKDLSETPTFAHHCGMSVPGNIPLSIVHSSSDFAPDADGPSSYKVIASQTKCPPGLTVHEFMAYQSLYSGKTRRWFSMLVELGSSNLNFSVEATMLLFCQLALQAGPAHEDDTLRTVHIVFRDDVFCERLIEQVDQRIDSIYSNWRESYCMEILVTLILRLCALGSGPTAKEGLRLLKKVRTATLQWISLLRAEVCGAIEADAAERATQYAFWAALICRRTFNVYIDKDGELGTEDLRSFIEASISLRENLVVDPAKLSPTLRNMLIRDMKMAFRMRAIIRESIESNPDSLTLAINGVWPEAEGDSGRSYSTWQFLSKPHEWWVASTVEATEFTSHQIVHYHLLEGYLFVDGKPLGKLPAEIRNSEILKELFGNQHLLTFPSALSGMTYMLAMPKDGHQIHLGYRDKKLLVRARVHNTVLEFVERSVFGSGSDPDLPASLIQNCVHWLDLRSGFLEIRRQPYIWKHKRIGNWVLNFHTRRAYRRTVSLVDPHSELFQHIAGIFQHFEHRHMLTAFQPSHRNLTVELKRLELDFTVNRRNLLESRQLRSEIDSDQDAGTLYGLESKIVLRDASNPLRRSLIVPMGQLHCKRNGMHVAVRVENDGIYGRYVIDDVLRRLQCPSEPLLLYSKARFHAFTSFILPDPLTGRTGTEEALHCLQSGYCQPWTPTSPDQFRSLISIARLTPRRQYYPKNLKRQQTVFWDPQLTSTIQHDSYRPVVEAIFAKSERLSMFTSQKMQLPPPEPEHIPHLRQRSYSRRHLYERPDSFSGEQRSPTDISYRARDRPLSAQGNINVYQTVNYLRKRPSCICTTGNLAQILQRWPVIGGYNRTFDKPLLSDLLHADFALEWGALVSLCRSSKSNQIYQLMFLLGVIAFGKNVDMDIVRTLIAFSVFEDLKVLDPPIYLSFEDFRLFQHPTLDSLMGLIEHCYEPYSSDYEWRRSRRPTARQLGVIETARREHEERCKNDGRNFASFLLPQWPCQEPIAEGLTATMLDIDKAMEVVRPEWMRLFQNLELSHHITQVQEVLNLHRAEVDSERLRVLHEEQELFGLRCHGAVIPTLSQDLLLKSGPVIAPDLDLSISESVPVSITGKQAGSLADGILPPSIQDRTRETAKLPSLSREIHELESIVNRIAYSRCPVRKQYGEDLNQSLIALKTVQSMPDLSERPLPTTSLDYEIGKARKALHDQYDEIYKAFTYDDSRFQWLQDSNLWPCVTPVTLLEQLRSTSNHVFGDRMKESLISYAVSITTLQRFLRMKDAHSKRDYRKLREEQGNLGHSNWQPLDYPDWLLLEIDADILIRKEQVNVALATILPESGSNSVLQMNMGQGNILCNERTNDLEGKTSCIMPMVAAVLADGKKLSRLIVPKALLLQTAQILQSRLGGLLGREIKHIPFSRKTSTKPATVKVYHDIHQDMLNSFGIILALPEHTLSFMLSGLQRLSDSRIREATQMVKVQSWIMQMCRDVLDECDYTLAVKTQLIYPSGTQLTVDGHPHRWETAQALLNLVEGHLRNLQHEFPHSIELVKRTAVGFPVVHFLRRDVEDALVVRLVDDICNGRTSILPTGDRTKDDRHAIRLFISEEKVDPEVVKWVARMFSDKPTATKNLFLLRGLLVHRILLLCLKKRWNVHYGLHPNRDPIAVPFHAKGVPSEQAEWGHPDVAILFTCLAFYYSGLSVAQLRQSLQHVLSSDDPSSEYDRWTHSSVELPESLRHWNVINVDDDGQILEIWNHLRLTIVVIDYYLNKFVFPVHAKQFYIKLQASGWDIPLFSPGAKPPTVNKARQSGGMTSNALTTGFSGTNDNRRMLPLTIRQEDLSGLSHTNAEVLTYLLQGRNRRYVLAANSAGKHLSELELLDRLLDMKIRILMDAGAHILEKDNKSLVKAWLVRDHEAQAAIYFDAGNKAWVLYPNGKGVPLLASPFADDLAQCLVYLDEAHTRGTDLKLPASARGALTLSLGQTKDHTVQAAMRLRQLGSTQSITFFAPPEVHQSILDLRNKKHGDFLDSSDVVCWLLEQTCSSNEQLQQLYFAQGTEFCHRTHAAWEYSNFLTDLVHRTAYLRVLQQPEQQTLEQLYSPNSDTKHSITTASLSPTLRGFVEELGVRHRGSLANSSAAHGSAFEQVEQEREVAFEVEEIREVQKPKYFEALSFPGLNSTILHFSKTGELIASQGYEQVFMALRRTGLGLKYGISATAVPSRLYVSSEFMRTVKLRKDQPNDNFLRPINWILWSPATQTALIIIPEEAEVLIPVIRAVKPPQTYLLVYAAPVTKKMLQFNNLMYYSLPSLPQNWKPPAWLTIELGIFAGRLYFEFAEYAALKKYLGLADMDLGGVGSVANDKVPVNAGEKAALKQIRSFTKKPLSFLQEWLAVRRKGQDVAHTPMGYVCQGQQLRASHPFFVARKAVMAGVGLDLGMTVRAGHGGIAGAIGDGNAEYESDASVDVDEDEMELEDKNRGDDV